MNLESIIIAVITVIGSVGGALIAAWYYLKRVKSQNNNDNASAVDLFERAAANRQIENDKLRQQIDKIMIRMQKLEAAISGPFRIVLEFTTSPELKINRAEIELLPPEVNIKAAEKVNTKKRAIDG